ncbi:MAG: mechanosensitive ion channel family protein [Nannocystaceae bacterium]
MDLVQQIIEFSRDHAAEWTWRIVAALATIFITWLIVRLLRSTLRRVMSGNDSRTRTLLPLVQALTTTVLMGTGAVLALEQLGFDLTAVIAGAGVLGLAVGFGAQELVKDVIAGFFLIFDEVLEAGDFVEVDTISGQVEEVGLRVTKVRSFDGKLWYVPNGRIQVVGNLCRDWIRAVVVVGLAYEQDAGRGMATLAEVGRQWAEDHAETVIDAPEVQGLLGLDSSSVGVRLVVKVKPGTHWSAERELRQRIKAAFDREGIEIPFGRQVVYLRQDQDEAVAS